MSDFTKVIDRIVAQGLAQHLKDEGYKRKGRNFYLASPRITKVVNVQASQFNLGEDMHREIKQFRDRISTDASGKQFDQGRFTLNLGIYSRELSKLAKQKLVQDVPKIYECTLYGRIGSLMPAKRDHWWKLPADESTIAKEFAQTWEQYGKPWMDNFIDKDSVLRGIDAYKDRFMANTYVLELAKSETQDGS